MYTKDSIQQFILSNQNIKGALVHLDKSYKESHIRHNFPDEVKKTLGELLSAATIFSTTTKFQGKITLQLQSNGPIQLMVVQITHEKKLRASVNYDNNTSTPKSLKEQFPKGTFIISIEPETGKRYDGVIEILKDSISQCLEQYFNQSEQLPTFFRTFSTKDSVAALFIQQLPQSAETSIQSDSQKKKWEHIRILTETITEKELLVDDNNTILYKLYHEEEVHIFDEQSVQYKCNCTRDKFLAAIRGLGAIEIEKMIAEGKPIEIRCQFCGKEQSFSVTDLTEL